MCLSEHFLRRSELEAFRMPGYTLAASYCRTQIEKGGVCIFTPDHIKYTVVDVSDFCIESVCELAAIKVTNGSLNTIFVCVYRSPSNIQSNIQKFLSTIQACFDSLKAKNLSFVVAGDFNIDLTDRDGPSAKLLIDLMLSFGLRDTIKTFTREFQGSRTIIDNIFTDIPEHLFYSSVLITSISDHMPN